MNKKNWGTALTIILLPILTTRAEYNTTSHYPEVQPVGEMYVPTSSWQHGQNERNMLPPALLPYPEATPQSYQGFVTPPPPKPVHFQPVNRIRMQPANYRSNPTRILRNALNCQQFNALNLPDHCIKRSHYNRQGLQAQLRYLRTRNPTQRVAGRWADVSNAALLETVGELLNWEQGADPSSFRNKFSLREIRSDKSPAKAHYTGYFTPVLAIQNYPDQHYRYPIYRRPPGGTRLSRRQIENGQLSGRNLEIAWTNDKINLFFAQIQGSAIARYPDGTERFLGFSAHNNHTFQKLEQVLRQQGYHNSSLSNDSVRRWLLANPQKMDTVLNHNPRYIFFSLSDRLPTTTNNSTVLPGHTLAVDSDYIPLGAVLLAEIPRIGPNGQKAGSDWRLLFAQDNGDAIKGPGRVDLYTGMGSQAEQKTYKLSGLHRTYLLLRKTNRQGQNVAGM